MSESIAERNTRETADSQIDWWQKARLSEYCNRDAVIRMGVLIEEIKRLRAAIDAAMDRVKEGG